jgi:hypothetical protein
MRRWSNIAAIGGFLLVLAIVTERFWAVRASLGTLRDWWPALLDFAKFVVIISAIFLAILWCGSLLRQRIWPKPQKPKLSSGVCWRHVSEIVVSSVVLGPMIEVGLRMGGPGMLAAGWVSYLRDRLGLQPNLGLSLALIFGIDTAVCFGILWGAYLLWQKVSGKPPKELLLHRSD